MIRSFSNYSLKSYILELGLKRLKSTYNYMCCTSFEGFTNIYETDKKNTETSHILLSHAGIKPTTLSAVTSDEVT